MSLPTPRTTLRAEYVRVLLASRACQRRRDADLQGFAEPGRGDIPLVELRWRCGKCGSARIDMVCMSKDSHAVAKGTAASERKRRPVGLHVASA
jgi:hypothetical protein